MSKASQRQMELVAAFGLFEGEDLTKAKASELITSAQAHGMEPDWELKEAAFLKIAQIIKRRTVAALKAAKAKNDDPEKIKELEEELEWLNEDIEEHKRELIDQKEEAREEAREEREELKDQREMLKDQVDEIHEVIDVYTNYDRLTKKPTKAEIKAIVEGMNEARPDWDMEEQADTFLIDNLYNNFEHLRTNIPRPSSQKKPQQAPPQVPRQAPLLPRAKFSDNPPRTPSRKKGGKLTETEKIIYAVVGSLIALIVVFIILAMNSSS